MFMEKCYPQHFERKKEKHLVGALSFYCSRERLFSADSFYLRPVFCSYKLEGLSHNVCYCGNQFSTSDITFCLHGC